MYYYCIVINMKSLITPQQDEQVKQLYLSGISLQRVANHFGIKNKQPILNSLKRTETVSRKYSNRVRSNDTRRLIKGYVHVYKPHHTNSRKDGYIALHRYLVSEQINRPLNKNEVVNHIDRNKLNNNISNLELLASQSVHMKKHYSEDFNISKDGKFKEN